MSSDLIVDQSEWILAKSEQAVSSVDIQRGLVLFVVNRLVPIFQPSFVNALIKRSRLCKLIEIALHCLNLDNCLPAFVHFISVLFFYLVWFIPSS